MNNEDRLNLSTPDKFQMGTKKYLVEVEVSLTLTKTIEVQSADADSAQKEVERNLDAELQCAEIGFPVMMQDGEKWEITEIDIGALVVSAEDNESADE